MLNESTPSKCYQPRVRGLGVFADGVAYPHDDLALTEYSIAQLQSSLPGLLTPSKAGQIQHQSCVAALALAAQHASKAYVFSLQHVIHPTPRVQQCHLKRHVHASHHFVATTPPSCCLTSHHPKKKRTPPKIEIDFTKSEVFHPKKNDSTKTLQPISVEIHCHL